MLGGGVGKRGLPEVKEETSYKRRESDAFMHGWKYPVWVFFVRRGLDALHAHISPIPGVQEAFCASCRCLPTTTAIYACMVCGWAPFSMGCPCSGVRVCIAGRDAARIWGADPAHGTLPWHVSFRFVDF